VKKKVKKRHPVRFLVLVVISAAAIIAVIKLTQTPAEYIPASGAGPDETVSTYLTHQLGPDFYNNIQLDEPFDIFIEQNGINEIIADGTMLGFCWPVELSGVLMSTPALGFSSGKISLFGRVDYGFIHVVVTIVASPSIDKDGLLSLNLDQVKAGALDITFLAKKTTGMIIENELKNTDDPAQVQWMRDLSDAALKNKPFEPIWPTCDGNSIKLLRSEIKEKSIILRFLPIEKSESEGDSRSN
jgi:hypothetical protein